MKINFLKTALIASVFISCDSKTVEEVSTPVNPTGTVTNPTYVANVKPIIQSNCINCHTVASGQSPALETYEQVKNASASVLERIKRTGSGVMPPAGRMPQTNIDVINLWITNGFINQ